MSSGNSLVDMSDIEKRIAGKIDPSVTNGLAVSDQAGGLAFANAGQVMEFAKLMAVSGVAVRKHLRNNPGVCAAICIQAIEWRMSPYAVANKSFVVNDQVAYEAQLIAAVILQRAPIKGRIKVAYEGQGDKRRCKVWADLRDEPGEIVEYESPELGRITPKNSPLWKTDPDQQQYYYSVRALARRHFPDVILGVYADDELPVSPHDRSGYVKNVTPRNMASRLDALAAGPQPDVAVTIEADDALDASDAEDGLAERAANILDSIDHSPRGIDVNDDRQVIAYAEGCDAAALGRDDTPPDSLTEIEAAAWRCGYGFVIASEEQPA